MIYEVVFSILNTPMCAVLPQQQIWWRSLAAQLKKRGHKIDKTGENPQRERNETLACEDCDEAPN